MFYSLCHPPAELAVTVWEMGILYPLCLLGVLLCSGSRLISGSNTKRLRLWAVGVVPELRRKGSSAR